jgi:hypothetical protein
VKTTANKFRKKPHEVYAEAAKGETVTINHDRYRNQVFELTARDRGAVFRPDQGDSEQEDNNHIPYRENY